MWIVLQIHVRVFARDRATRAAARHEQNVGELSVAPDVRADDAVLAAAMSQNGRAGAVAEKHAGVAIGPVRDRGQFFGADDQHGVVGVRGDELLGDFDSKQKTGAGGRDIETGGVLRADFLLHETRGRRKQHVRRGGGDEDEIDLLRRNLRLLERFQRGLRRHVAGLFVFRRDATFFDAGASGDPLVAGVDDLREVGVGEAFLRHVTAGANDRDGPARFTGARARARLSFHDNGELPRRYAGSPGVQSTRPPPAARS